MHAQKRSISVMEERGEKVFFFPAPPSPPPACTAGMPKNARGKWSEVEIGTGSIVLKKKQKKNKKK